MFSLFLSIRWVLSCDLYDHVLNELFRKWEKEREINGEFSVCVCVLSKETEARNWGGKLEVLLITVWFGSFESGSREEKLSPEEKSLAS
jgi:hypothetical protein